MFGDTACWTWAWAHEARKVKEPSVCARVCFSLRPLKIARPPRSFRVRAVHLARSRNGSGGLRIRVYVHATHACIIHVVCVACRAKRGPRRVAGRPLRDTVREDVGGDARILCLLLFLKRRGTTVVDVSSRPHNFRITVYKYRVDDAAAAKSIGCYVHPNSIHYYYFRR